MEEAGERNYSCTILSIMKKFHAEGKHWDVQLQVGAQLFKCQRSFLAAASEYFDTMFDSDFKESKTTSDQPIILQEMDASTFEEILGFMYTNKICVDDSNILQLLFMNDFLRLRTTYLKKQCVKHLKWRAKSHMRISNAFDLLNFACMKSETLLMNILSAHICEHLYNFSNDNGFLKIHYESLNALVKFSQNYILPLSGSQNVVLKIILNWVSYNHKERSKYRYELMRNIKFSNVSSSFTLDLINGLANFADEVIGLPNNTESLDKLETLKIKVETNLMNMDNDRQDAIIFFDVHDIFGTLNGRPLYSSSSTISNFSWRTGLQNVDGNLLVFLHCLGTPASSVWNCYASVIFWLVSYKEGKEDFVRRKVQSLFSSDRETSCLGFKKFLSWTELIDPENGYVRDDNSITIKAHVYCDLPFGERRTYST